MLLNVVIPLWLVEETDAPRVLLAWLFGTNTVMAVLLQVSAARGVELGRRRRCAPPGSARASSCCRACIVLVTHDTLGWVTIALVWLGHVTVTGAELFQSAAHVGLPVRALRPAPARGVPGRRPHRRHRRRGLGPAVYTFLAMEWGTPGWLMIAAIVVVATLRDGAGVAVRPALPRCRAGAARLLESSLVTTPRTSAAHWLAGARPRTLPAAVAPVLAGTGVAAYADSAVWWKAALALLVSLALQVGVNYANDYSDGIRGTDADRVGPMRLVGSGAASPRAVKTAAFLAFGVAGAGRPGAGRDHRVVAAGGRRRLRGGGVVLHRRVSRPTATWRSAR